jgi:hypothetical protein
MREKGRSLQEIERWLERSLQAEFPSIVPLKIHCVVREDTFLVSVHVIESNALSPSLVLPLLEKEVANREILADYPLETFWIVHEESRFEALSSAALVPFSSVSLVYRQNRRFFHYSQVVVGFLATISLLGSFFLFTRPCFGETCPELEQAQHLGERAIRVIEPDGRTAKQDISRSLALLASIPPWSPAHERSVSLGIVYREKAREIDLAIAILDRARRAELLGRDNSLSISQLQEIRGLWRDNLAYLSSFSRYSPLHDFSRRKIPPYQANLAKIDRRIDRERLAIQNLEKAQKIAEIAIKRQKVAKSVTDYQLIENTWRQALDQVRAIPADTHASRMALRQEEIYRTGWTTARSLRQAFDRAKKAEKAAKNYQWSESVTYWQEGLNFLQPIPRDSREYPQVEKTIALYQRSLQQARQREQIDKDLQQICKRTVNICSYEVGADKIRIYLTREYAGKVQNTALEAQNRADTRVQVDLWNHLARIESAFQEISDRGAKTVEIYNVDRVLLSIYEPKGQITPRY